VGKKIKGRKRHIGVDTLGNLLSVIVRQAGVHDTKGGPELFQILFEKYRSIKAFCADAGYCGTTVSFVENMLKLTLNITKKIVGEGFTAIPKRWVVERSIAWINNSRRLSKDFEIKNYISANMVRISMIKLTLVKAF
jgi:transposase